MNAARVARPWTRAKLAVGATDEQSRIASGNGYGGNALTPTIGGFVDNTTLIFRHVMGAM